MSYYMGDYRGDYYQGDPGIGSFLGGLVKHIPVIGSFAEPAISAVGKLLGRTSSRVNPLVAHALAPAAAAISAAAGAGRAAAALAIRHPVLTAAGGAGLVAAGGAAEMLHRTAPTAAGMRMTGGVRRGRVVSMGRRRRRMNVANGRALNRAVRRLHSFARRYRKVVGFVSPRKPKGRMYFKRRKRAAA
jgi:hypothetical protein